MLDVRGLRLSAHGGELPREEVDRPGEPPVDFARGPRRAHVTLNPLDCHRRTSAPHIGGDAHGP